MYLNNVQVKEERLNKGWTQQQLADACGVSMRTVQRVEKDGVASLDTTAALCAVFELERQALLRISPPSEEMPQPNNIPWWIPALAGVLVGVLATLLVS